MTHLTIFERTFFFPPFSCLSASTWLVFERQEIIEIKSESISSVQQVLTGNFSIQMLSEVRCCCSFAQRVQLFVAPWTAALQASLSFTISWSLLKLSIESVMPSNRLIFCRPLLLLPSIFPSIQVFANELALCIRWPKDWSFSLPLTCSGPPCPNLQSGGIKSCPILCLPFQDS